MVRLVIGLALVVVVMRQASDESLYRPFFTPPVMESAAGKSATRSVSSAPTVPFDDAFRRAMDRVVDGSVWRGADFDAFYLALHLCGGDAVVPDATVVGVVPLLQQPDVFRGRVVSFAGTVARSEKLASRENEFGIETYWQLWLRPIGGADRPVVAIVGDVPDAVAAIGSDASTEDGPAVNVVGVFIKRLAYRSAAGADLAPVVIGRLDRATMVDAVAPRTNHDVDQATAGLPAALAWAVLAACLVGIAIAGLVSWRMSVMTRRGRELRTAGQPDRGDFFKRLEQDQA